MIRLHILLYDLQPGGAENQTLHLVRHLASRGFRVKVTCLGEAGELHLAFQQAATEVELLRHVPIHTWAGGTRRIRPWRLGGLLPLMRSLFESVRRFGPDILYSALDTCNLPAAVVAPLVGVPRLVVSSVNVKETPLDRLLSDVYQRIPRQTADAIVCNTFRAREEIRKGLVSGHRLRVIRTGVDLALFDPTCPLRGNVRRALRLAPEAIVALVVGRLHPSKGQDILLRSLHRVPEGRRPVLICAGRDQSFLQVLECLAHTLEIEPWVRFLGHRDDIPDLLQAADLLVLPSREEGLPGALIEGMAAGRAILATRVGGVDELIDDGETGLLVPPSEPVALTLAMQRLQKDGDLRNRLGRAARKRVEVTCSMDVMLAAYEGLFRDLAGMGTGG